MIDVVVIPLFMDNIGILVSSLKHLQHSEGTILNKKYIYFKIGSTSSSTRGCQNGWASLIFGNLQNGARQRLDQIDSFFIKKRKKSLGEGWGWDMVGWGWGERGLVEVLWKQ